MMVWSDQDTVLCRDGAEATKQFVTGPVRLETLHGINHWLADDGSDQLNALLLDPIGTYREKK